MCQFADLGRIHRYEPNKLYMAGTLTQIVDFDEVEVVLPPYPICLPIGTFKPLWIHLPTALSAIVVANLFGTLIGH